MNNWKVFSILSFLFLIGSNCDASRRRRMVGGTDAEIEEFPHIVSFRYLGMHVCGGSIISESHILTAAHCIADLEPYDEITVHSGTSRSDKEGIVHEIKEVLTYPHWNASDNSGYVNDIAVVTLKDQIIFNKYQNKIKLPSRNVQYNEAAYLAGWGRKVKWSEARSAQLQKLLMNLITIEKCQSLMIHKIHPKHVCAITKRGTGMCKGDSGGPLTYKGELIAMSSFLNEDDCANGKPAGLINVFLYKDFIRDAMRKC